MAQCGSLALLRGDARRGGLEEGRARPRGSSCTGDADWGPGSDSDSDDQDGPSWAASALTFLGAVLDSSPQSATEDELRRAAAMGNTEARARLRDILLAAASG